MFQKTDLAAIALDVTRDTKLEILNLLHKKYPTMPFDPLRLADLETRLRNFIFEELCLSLLRKESREDFLVRMSLELQRQQQGGSTSVDWEALEQATKEDDRNG